MLPLILLAVIADGAALRDGVDQIAAPGVPGSFSVYGEAAFPVIAGRSGRQSEPVVAAGELGTGRFAAFAHTAYLDPDALNTADTGRLFLNILRWVRRDPRPVGFIGNEAGRGWLNARGIESETATYADLSKFSAVCVNLFRQSDAEIEALRRYVKDGGGLVATSLGWGWLQLTQGQTLRTHPGNKLLSEAGVVWTDATLERTSGNGFNANAPADETHAQKALQALLSGEGNTAQASTTLTRALRNIPADDTIIRPKIVALREGSAAIVPSGERPLNNGRGLERLLLTMEVEELLQMPPDLMSAHPAAEHFPGLPEPGAQKTTKTIQMDTSRPRWHSTGLYAAPGEAISVIAPSSAVGKGLRVRIGCHTDELWHHETWPRVPRIWTAFDIASDRTTAANPFGGLVYIEVPQNAGLGQITVRIENAIEAPRFVLGKTTNEEWREKIRHHPAPWAEFESSKIVLSVPSRTIRNLDDPETVMRFWDEVMDACADLATIPRERRSAERIVPDILISAGYMHAGYPIMTHMDVDAEMTDIERLRKGNWGFFHEIGHNHQHPDWTFGGTGEVTVNLFSLYVFEKICGVQLGGHPALAQNPGKLKAAIDAGNKPWASGDLFLMLHMYVQMQQAFGWDAYKQVFAEYRDLPANQRPRNDDEKRDQWLVRFSRTVGRNLGPFFEAWGVPTSQSARDSIRELPTWMPPDWPER